MTVQSTDQLPPADELFATRAEIKRLTEREAALKALMINDPSARTGNAYVVEIREVVSNRTDLKELRAERPDWVDEHTYPVTTTRVEIACLNEDGEIISLRRKAAY